MNKYYNMKRGVALTGLITMIASASVGLIATIALAFATSTNSSVAELSTKVSDHTTEIALLKQSACIQSQNTVNIGRKLNVEVVADPNCK